MARGERVEAHLIEGFFDTDEAYKRAQEAVDSGMAAEATIHNAATGEVVGKIEPLPEGVTSKAGYTASYSSAWDAMMERRAKRVAQGQKTTTDD